MIERLLEPLIRLAMRMYLRRWRGHFGHRAITLGALRDYAGVEDWR